MWKSDRKEGWVLKNWCFRIVVLKRLLRVPWTVRRSDQSILKEISPEHSLEGLMWKLKLQYFGHLMQRTDSFEETLLLGKIEGRKRRGLDGWMVSLTEWTWVDISSGSSWCTGKPGVLQSMGLQRVRHDWANELNWILFHYRYQALLSIIACALHITEFSFSFLSFFKAWLMGTWNIPGHVWALWILLRVPSR